MSQQATGPAHRRAALGVVVAAGLTLTACASTTAPSVSSSSASSTPRRPAASQPGGATTTTAPAAPVAAGFAPLSVTFVSAQVGWVLGTAPSGDGTRLAVAHTTDGGTTWSQGPAPAVTFGTGGAANGARIRFADPADGWIVTPPTGSTGAPASTLWATHDGGASWHQVTVPGGGAVAALEASDGLAHLVTLGPNGTGVHLFTSSVPGDSWARSATTLPIGGGPVPSAELTLHGAAGWLVENDRVVVAGARLASSGWARWTPPCTDANGLAHLAASSSSDLVAVCDEGQWGPPAPGTTAQAAWLFTSTDGGSHFTAVGEVDSPAVSASSVATAPGDPQVVVVAGPGLTASFDGGHTWRTVYTPPSGQTVRFVGFTTATQGVAITAGASSSTLLMTHDGGSTWSAVALSATSAS